MSTDEDLIKIQNAILGQLKDFVKNFKKTPKDRLARLGHIQGRITVLTAIGNEFKANDLQIRALGTDNEKTNSYFAGTCDEFADLYYENMGNLNDIHDSLTSPLAPQQTTASTANQNLGNNAEQSNSGTSEQSSSVAVNASSNLNASSLSHLDASTLNNSSLRKEIKLPQITIPKFSGDYSSWPPFYDLFKCMIHENEKLSPVQKMHYLKSCLAGEAEQLTRHLTITQDNYQVAWNVLCKRFQNTRVLVNTTLKILFSQPHVQTESSVHIRNLLDRTNECLASLNNLGINTKEWDPIILYLMADRLPNETRQLWEQKQGSKTNLPELSELLEFLEARFRSLEALPSKLQRTSRSSTSKANSYHSTKFRCPLCKDSHALKDCSKFRKMTPQERWQVVISNTLCFNCLAQSHTVSNCASGQTCRVCQKRHNTLLHKPSPQSDLSSTKSSSASMPTSAIPARVKSPTLPPTSHSENSGQEDPSRVKTYFSVKRRKVLLATVLVKVLSKGGDSQVCRALVDLGSEAAFVTNKVVKGLGLRPFKDVTHITGLGNVVTAKSQGAIFLKIQPYANDSPTLDIKASILNSLTDSLPATDLSEEEWTHLKGLPLADPSFRQSGKIDMILDASTYGKIIQNGIVRGGPGMPVAQNTSFGWIVFGEIPVQPLNFQSERVERSSVALCSQVMDVSDDTLKRFWELEEVSFPESRSPDDEYCEEHFMKTHSRRSDGRYIVRLPFNPVYKAIKFTHSRDIALKRYHSLEKRLESNCQLRTDYNECIQEYVDENQMKIVPPSEVSKMTPETYYIPHHAVFKSDSLTTKTRVVFDASCRASNNQSLNDLLLPGPALQRDISLLLCEWRQRKFVFTADIARMYRQILLHPDECDFQRILWRPSPQDPVQDFRLLTVTFGIRSSPFLAIRTIQQLAQDEAQNFPLGARALLTDLYVDDVLSGGNTLEEVIEIRNQIDKILKAGKFELRKWAANNPQLLEGISESNLLSAPSVNFDNTVKTLGIIWKPSNDTFSYNINLKTHATPFTKRKVLSTIAHVYDPLGWLSPITVTSKIFLQILWQRQLGWDEPLPRDLAANWLNYMEMLFQIRDISIPRFLGTESFSNIQIHGFCDASERAYAAALYIRCEINSVVTTLLIGAKTKVAPLNSISLPRLELCGAVLLSKLVKKFQPSLPCTEGNIFLWTDSTIVLSWLNQHPNSFKPFVSNRISEIITNVSAVRWSHVSSSDNPADSASRGLQKGKLAEFKLWWQGPEWLSQPQSCWPSRFTTLIDPKTKPDEFELKSSKNFLVLDNTNTDASYILQRFSSLPRLLKVTVILKRIAEKGRNKNFQLSAYMTPGEFKLAREFWLKHEQAKAFPKEIRCLQTKTPISKTSKLRSLTPFLDESGIVRVGGRLQNASIPFSQQHPIILDGHSHFTELLVRHTHVVCLHGGLTLTLALLRKTVWIVHGRNTVKKILRKCITCFKQSVNPQIQLMGSLPTPRVNVSRPFTNVGVDYAGPFNLSSARYRGCRTHKGYFAIFVCLCTKAMHIEVVSELTTDAFLGAFRRLVARRGLPLHVYSDNGTNFKGARNKLDYDIKMAYERAARETANVVNIEGIHWHFIPPASPHFGGLWEAGVKSVKYHLKRIVGESRLTFEEMSTFVAQVEACLNSRPLCPLSDDVGDFGVLTPGHFLIGDSLLSPPEEDLIAAKVTSLNRWKFVQRMTQHFWKIWSREYLSRLQQRPKWLHSSKNLKPGDLVLLKDENLACCKWALGRVIRTYPGSDGIVRVVDLLTQNGEKKRPITKLSVLPINIDE